MNGLARDSRLWAGEGHDEGSQREYAQSEENMPVPTRVSYIGPFDGFHVRVANRSGTLATPAALLPKFADRTRKSAKATVPSQSMSPVV